MYCAISIAYIFKYCQDNQSKKSKYFLKSHLTLRNLFSIIVKQIALGYLLNNRITVICHGNGISARAKELAEQENVTEELKATDQMLWVQKMNNIRNRATEIVNSELIYTV